MNKKCNKCGGTLPEGALFCMKCGEKVVEVACSQCGKSLPEEAKFCVYCGQVIGKEEAQSTPVDIATIEETSTPQVTAVVEDEFANSDTEELEEELVDPDALFYEETNAAYLAFVNGTDCEDEVAELNHFIESFETLGNYKDAADKKSICQERLLDIKYTALMKRMEGAAEISTLIQLQKGFEKLGDYKDALEQWKICQKKIDWQVNLKREESAKQKQRARIEAEDNRKAQQKKKMRIGLGCGIVVSVIVIIAVFIGIGNNNEIETALSEITQSDIGYEINSQTGEILYYPGDCMSYGLFYDLAYNRDFISDEVHTNYVTLCNFSVSQLNKYGYIICTGYVNGEWYEVLIRVNPDQMESFIHTSEITAYGVLRLSGDSDNKVYIEAEHVTLYEDAFLTWAISDGA